MAAWKYVTSAQFISSKYTRTADMQLQIPTLRWRHLLVAPVLLTLCTKYANAANLCCRDPFPLDSTRKASTHGAAADLVEHHLGRELIRRSGTAAGIDEVGAECANR